MNISPFFLIFWGQIFLGNNFISSCLISDYISRFLGRMMAFIFQPQNNKHGLELENLPGPWPWQWIMSAFIQVSSFSWKGKCSVISFLCLRYWFNWVKIRKILGFLHCSNQFLSLYRFVLFLLHLFLFMTSRDVSNLILSNGFFGSTSL